MPWPSAVHASNDGIGRNVVTFYIDLDNIAMNEKKTRVIELFYPSNGGRVSIILVVGSHSFRLGLPLQIGFEYPYGRSCRSCGCGS